jgi:hypothetical protein
MSDESENMSAFARRVQNNPRDLERVLRDYIYRVLDERNVSDADELNGDAQLAVMDVPAIIIAYTNGEIILDDAETILRECGGRIRQNRTLFGASARDMMPTVVGSWKKGGIVTVITAYAVKTHLENFNKSWADIVDLVKVHPSTFISLIEGGVSNDIFSNLSALRAPSQISWSDYITMLLNPFKTNVPKFLLPSDALQSLIKTAGINSNIVETAVKFVLPGSQESEMMKAAQPVNHGWSATVMNGLTNVVTSIDKNLLGGIYTQQPSQNFELLRRQQELNIDRLQTNVNRLAAFGGNATNFFYALIASAVILFIVLFFMKCKKLRANPEHSSTFLNNYLRQKRSLENNRGSMSGMALVGSAFDPSNDRYVRNDRNDQLEDRSDRYGFRAKTTKKSATKMKKKSATKMTKKSATKKTKKSATKKTKKSATKMKKTMKTKKSATKTKKTKKSSTMKTMKTKK